METTRCRRMDVGPSSRSHCVYILFIEIHGCKRQADLLRRCAVLNPPYGLVVRLVSNSFTATGKSEYCTEMHQEANCFKPRSRARLFLFFILELEAVDYVKGLDEKDFVHHVYVV